MEWQNHPTKLLNSPDLSHEYLQASQLWRQTNLFNVGLVPISLDRRTFRFIDPRDSLYIFGVSFASKLSINPKSTARMHDNGFICWMGAYNISTYIYNYVVQGSSRSTINAKYVLR